MQSRRIPRLAIIALAVTAPLLLLTGCGKGEAPLTTVLASSPPSATPSPQSPQSPPPSSSPQSDDDILYTDDGIITAEPLPTPTSFSATETRLLAGLEKIDPRLVERLNYSLNDSKDICRVIEIAKREPDVDIVGETKSHFYHLVKDMTHEMADQILALLKRDYCPYL